MLTPRPRRLELAGLTAVVTGAASGLGRHLALVLVARGCRVALADLDLTGLQETASLATTQSTVTLHRLDVSDVASVAAFAAEVMEQHGGVQLLFNNAGVYLGGLFEHTNDADCRWLFEVNFWGTVHMTRAFLPLLDRAGEEARLVNISSLFGLIAPPGQAMYAASKFAVRGFSGSLRAELAGTNVGLTVVHPGGVATRLIDNARFPAGSDAGVEADMRARCKRYLTMAPERAAELVVAAVERRKNRVVIGRDANILAMLERLLPDGFEHLASRLGAWFK